MKPLVLTIDVEPWYVAHTVDRWVDRRAWNTLPHGMDRPIETLLDLLDHHGSRATFFMLGHAVRRSPVLLRRIVDRGHHVACHGDMHERMHRLDAERFRADLARARRTIEDCCGRRVDTYRAPAFSVRPGNAWFYPTLADEGFRVDSSVMASGWHPDYGSAGWPAAPFRHASGVAVHPVAVATVGPWRFPCAGGGWLRHLPPWSIRRGLRAVSRRDGYAVFYLHPWDLWQPAPLPPMPWTQRLRMGRNVGNAMARLDALLALFTGSAALDEVPPCR